ncbi:hypothetical protein OSB04_010011 [Centaurea solstitialis]|uniref:Uncharacterized protein n=1 Tax=Centaurea solstitialis TaxID=347529 RepID=A0AA38WBH2_9ASTR|nr:hypothetical protein OSB04_010011 [Centaurea solstitialis]
MEFLELLVLALSSLMERGAGGSVAGSSRKAEMKQRVPKRFEVVEERIDIDKKADDFIKNFRNQLKIQRAESIKRFHEMINRAVMEKGKGDSESSKPGEMKNVLRRFDEIVKRRDINRKADDFIKNFRDQLRIQRAESLNVSMR